MEQAVAKNEILFSLIWLYSKKLSKYFIMNEKFSLTCATYWGIFEYNIQETEWKELLNKGNLTSFIESEVGGWRIRQDPLTPSP